jgi:hypothetical protein
MTVWRRLKQAPPELNFFHVCAFFLHVLWRHSPTATLPSALLSVQAKSKNGGTLMKRVLMSLVAAAALPAFAMAQTAPNDKNHPPEKAMDSATPEMKNPGGTEGLHPPQKAMDQATPTEKKSDANTGDSSGESGASKTWNADDAKGGAASGETKGTDAQK